MTHDMTNQRIGFIPDGGNDPHQARRRAILAAHPEVKTLYGPDRRTAVVVVLLVTLQLGLAAVFGERGLNVSPLMMVILSYLIGALLAHFMMMAIHECAHDLAARTRLGNKLVALTANLPILVPMAMSFCRYHKDHHRFLGQRGLDKDLPSEFEIRWFGRGVFRKLVWMLCYPLIASLCRGFMKNPNRWQWVNVGLQVLLCAGVWALLGPKSLLFLGLSALFGAGLHPAAAYWVHEHYAWSPDQETYSYYGVLNLVSFNVGYHVEHHDFMVISGWQLPLLHDCAPEFYAPLISHRSWTKVMLQFIFDDQITHARRFVRASKQIRSKSGAQPSNHQRASTAWLSTESAPRCSTRLYLGLGEANRD